MRRTTEEKMKTYKVIRYIGYTTLVLSSATLLYRLIRRRWPTSSQQLVDKQHFTSNGELIQHLVNKDYIQSDVLERAMKLVDRSLYCRNFVQNEKQIVVNPYEDAAQPLIANATISAPHMHATCLQSVISIIQDKLQRKEHVTILDIGSGSGYCCAVFAQILKLLAKGDNQLLNQCKIYGIEHVEDLVHQSIENLQKDPQMKDLIHLIDIKQGDGLLGNASAAPFDIIHCGAALSDLELSGANLFSQLDQNGRMVVPIGPHHSYQALSVVEKKVDGAPIVQPLMRVRFVPLSDLEYQLNSSYTNHVQPKLFKGGDDTMLVLPFIMNLDGTSNIKRLEDIKWEGSE